MTFLDSMISKFDALVLYFVPDSQLKQREEEFWTEMGSLSSDSKKAIYEAYDSIDTKATAVLQHVSIMIAVTGILYSQASRAFKWFFGTETLVYVILALFCLRLLMVQHHSSNFGDTKNVVAKEALLDVTAKLTFLISIVLIATVLIELVVG
jgi:hypothetical protein